MSPKYLIPLKAQAQRERDALVLSLARETDVGRRSGEPDVDRYLRLAVLAAEPFVSGRPFTDYEAERLLDLVPDRAILGLADAEAYRLEAFIDEMIGWDEVDKDPELTVVAGDLRFMHEFAAAVDTLDAAA